MLGPLQSNYILGLLFKCNHVLTNWRRKERELGAKDRGLKIGHCQLSSTHCHDAPNPAAMADR
jgi:hypothetical protein